MLSLIAIWVCCAHTSASCPLVLSNYAGSMHSATYPTVQHSTLATAWLSVSETRRSVQLLGTFIIMLVTCMLADWSTVFTSDQIHPGCCQPMTCST